MLMRADKFLFLFVVTVFFVLFTLTGCSKKKPDSEAVQEEAVNDSEALGPSESLYTDEASSTEFFPEGENVLEGRTSGPMLPIYFDFDASRIREDQAERIGQNGDFLRTNQDYYVRIEGNCDSRGTNEYNLALGERRAQAAKKYLIRLGIAEDRLSTLSWGEEKPLVFGQDEVSWAQNRRDDFVLVE